MFITCCACCLCVIRNGTLLHCCFASFASFRFASNTEFSDASHSDRWPLHITHTQTYNTIILSILIHIRLFCVCVWVCWTACFVSCERYYILRFNFATIWFYPSWWSGIFVARIASCPLNNCNIMSSCDQMGPRFIQTRSSGVLWRFSWTARNRYESHTPLNSMLLQC